MMMDIYVCQCGGDLETVKREGMSNKYVCKNCGRVYVDRYNGLYDKENEEYLTEQKGGR